MVAGRKYRALLNTVEVAGPGGALQGLWECEAGFDLLLLLEPIGETAVFPVGDVRWADAGMAPGTEPMGDVGIGAARAKHLVDVIADFRREGGNLASSLAGGRTG